MPRAKVYLWKLLEAHTWNAICGLPSVCIDPSQSRIQHWLPDFSVYTYTCIGLKLQGHINRRYINKYKYIYEISLLHVYIEKELLNKQSKIISRAICRKRNLQLLKQLVHFIIDLNWVLSMPKSTSTKNSALRVNLCRWILLMFLKI